MLGAGRFGAGEERREDAGELLGVPVRIAHTGPGGAGYAASLTKRLDATLPGQVLLLGTAGALEPVLAIGDVVVADRPAVWAKLAGAASGRASGGGAERIFGDRSFRVHRGRIVTVERPVMDERARRRLSRLTGAACADMEAGHVAPVCAERGVPFLVIKGISDLAGGGSPFGRGRGLRRAIEHATLVAVAAIAKPGV